MESQEREAELVELLSDSVNVGLDSQSLVEGVAREHRWLQGAIFDEVVKPLVCEYARMADEGAFDARNQRQVEECREVAEAMNWTY